MATNPYSIDTTGATAPLTPTVKSITQTASIDAQGNVVPVVNVSYVVGTHGPFTAQFPAATFTAQMAQAVMNKQAAEINALTTPA